MNLPKLKNIKGHKIKYIKQGIYYKENYYQCECGEGLLMKGINRARDFHYNYQLKPL